MNRLCLFAGCLAAATAYSQQPKLGIVHPKLVLLISIDQFRQDYSERFVPYYLPAKSGGTLGGFRFLEETGARFLDAHHNHIPTATGPGHATLMTGSEPAVDGIIGNDWFDRVAGRPVYCVDDPSVQVVGGGKTSPMSAKKLQVTTVGDELKMATAGRSKVIGISFKDRAAILMAGHAADEVIWLDSGAGNWVSSSFFFPNGQLPDWVQKLNEERLVDKSVGQSWTPLLPNQAYELTRKNPGLPVTSSTLPFSHLLGNGRQADPAFYSDFTTSGQGQGYLFETVNRAIDAENLGGHDVPDILVVNLATNDYVGHSYGPNSPEIMDISVRTDRLLSQLFNHLNKRVGIDNVDIVVTADHGVLPVVEESARTYRTSSIRLQAPVKEISDALSKAYGPGDWMLGDGLYEQDLFLNHKTIAAKRLKLRDVEQTAADAAMECPGVFEAFTRTQILSGDLPKWAWTQMVTNGYHPKLGGDVMVMEGPGVYFGGGVGTGHGSVWAYDTHVPLLLRGPGIKKGTYGRRVYTADIASTLCHLLGIEYPTGNLGQPLYEAIAQ